jgi:prevent-host-death family protein
MAANDSPTPAAANAADHPGVLHALRRYGAEAQLDVDHSVVYMVCGNWSIEWTIVKGFAMRISVTEAKGQLTELVRRAEAGDEVILTRHGQAAVRLVPVNAVSQPQARRKILEAARRSGIAKSGPGPDAARSQDFLYGEDGLPT